MDLYLDRLPELENSFRKEAGFAARLSEAPENWPQELTSELMRQLPFLSDYEVNVNLDRVDAQRGFAFGYADLSNRTERPEIEHQEMGMPHVRIPLVIQDRAVKPFTVFMDGEKVMPLTEERIREMLFNSQTFDISNSEPKDPSMVEQLMPPGRSGFGMGGEMKTAGIGDAAIKAGTFLSKNHAAVATTAGAGFLGQKYGESVGKKKALQSMGKVATGTPANVEKALASGASKEPYCDGCDRLEKQCVCSKKRASILKAIAPTLRESDVEAFVEKVASDASLQAGFRRSGIAVVLVDVLENTERMSSTERLEKIAGAIAPTVITIQKLPGGDFLFKTANTNAFAGGQAAQGQVVPEEQAAAAMGQENAQAMQPGQTATAVSDPVEPTPAYTMNEKIVEEFGEWLVQDSMGNRLMGWAFPEVLAWDGNFTPQKIGLFTNGSAYAFQDTIAGELVGKSCTFPSDTPRGDGVFYTTEGGRPRVTAPLMIGSSMAGPDGLARFVGTDVMGTPVQVSLQEGLREPMRVSDAEYALPSHWKFMRLNNQTELAADPVQMNKAAQVRDMNSSVTLFWNGSYNLEGGCGLPKLAHDLRYDLDPVTAEFMLGVLGVDGSLAKQKVAEARRKGSVKLAGLKTITLLSERYAEVQKTASALARAVPNLRRDLIKEAAALEDSGTVDNILALNFLNPENIAEFVDNLPELEQTSEHLAEMLLSCYLGAQDIPEGAVERAMKNLEEVISGLKALQNVEAQ